MFYVSADPILHFSWSIYFSETWLCFQLTLFCISADPYFLWSVDVFSADHILHFSWPYIFVFQLTHIGVKRCCVFSWPYFEFQLTIFCISADPFLYFSWPVCFLCEVLCFQLIPILYLQLINNLCFHSILDCSTFIRTSDVSVQCFIIYKAWLNKLQSTDEDIVSIIWCDVLYFVFQGLAT